VSTHPRPSTPDRPRVVLVMACAALMASLVTISAREGAWRQVPSTQGASGDLDEKELAVRGERATMVACDTACHGLEFLDTRLTVQEWNDEMAAMVSVGLMISDEEDALVRRYLKRYYGVVDVNAAPAADLSAVLGLSAAAAQAIVADRTAHGRFADAEALVRVPGIDRTWVEAHQAALRFGGS
jgi:competence ComEA-like helix-hairpin-helix protein